MLEVVGDIWDYHDQGHWVAITTNGCVKTSGSAIMGRGVALQAAEKWPELPRELGKWIRSNGNVVYMSIKKRLFTFPTKHDWRSDSDIDLIEQSARRLRWLAGAFSLQGPIYLPRPGCGNGRLEWSEVEPLLSVIFDSRFVVVSQEK
jgi:hypothetical protein